VLPFPFLECFLEVLFCHCQALCDSACISSFVSNRRPFSFNLIFGNSKKSQGAKSGEYGGVGDDSHLLFRQKVLGDNGSMRRGFVMANQPGLFSSKFGATSSHVFTQSPQNVVLKPGIHSLACWDRCFALPQLLYRWRHQFGIFWIPPRMTRLTDALHNVLYIFLMISISVLLRIRNVTGIFLQ
jgi:hypothetical protein